MQIKAITIIATLSVIGLTVHCNIDPEPDRGATPLVDIDAPAAPVFSGIDVDRFHNKTFLVVRVVDGDTIDIALSLSDPNRTRIRLLGVDTPETVHPRMSVQHFGPESTRFVTHVCLNRRVEILLDPLSDIRGKYGRLLAFVILDDSSVLNERLLTLGLGYAETRYPHMHKARYKILEQAAHATSTGLWQNVTFEQLPPWIQRTEPNILNTPD